MNKNMTAARTALGRAAKTVWSNKSPEYLAREASFSLFLTDDDGDSDEENDLVDYNKIILKISHGVTQMGILFLKDVPGASSIVITNTTT
jgi:hypothetical protein